MDKIILYFTWEEKFHNEVLLRGGKIYDTLDVGEDDVCKTVIDATEGLQLKMLYPDDFYDFETYVQKKSEDIQLAASSFQQLASASIQQMMQGYNMQSAYNQLKGANKSPGLGISSRNYSTGMSSLTPPLTNLPMGKLGDTY